MDLNTFRQHCLSVVSAGIQVPLINIDIDIFHHHWLIFICCAAYILSSLNYFYNCVTKSRKTLIEFGYFLNERFLNFLRTKRGKK